VQLVPVINGQPIAYGELVGDALSVISMKQPTDETDSDSLVQRQSFRCLQFPELSSLSWVSQAENKEQVRLHHRRIDLLEQELSKCWHGRHGRITVNSDGTIYKLGYFWVSLRTPVGVNFDASLATGDPLTSDRL